MLPYYADLFQRAFSAIPGLLGSNALGLLWPVVIVSCGEIIACFVYGWRTVISKWRQASVIGFAALGVCYSVLFGWSILSTSYQDHATLASTNRDLRTSVDSAASHERNSVLSAENKCAETNGENKILGQQNRDQQNTINNCQTQAIHLLQPALMEWKPLALEMPDKDPSNSANEKTRWILVTNKAHDTPVEITFSCSNPIVSAESKIAGSMANSVTTPLGTLGEGQWGTKIFSPAWGPDSPILLIMTVSNPRGEHTECKFKLG